MRRRAFLAALTASTGVALSGCESMFGTGTDEPREGATLTAAPVPTASARGSATRPDSGGAPTDGDAPTDGNLPTGTLAVALAPDAVSPDSFEGWTLPPLDTDADRTLAYHALDDGSAPLSLGPTSETFEVDGTLTFVLANREGKPYRFNPYRWRVLGLDGDEWNTVTVGLGRPGELRVDRGDAYTWTAIRTSTSSVPLGTYRHSFPVSISPGRYAFTVAGEYGGTSTGGASGRSTGSGSASRVRLVAPFAVRQ